MMDDSNHTNHFRKVMKEYQDIFFKQGYNMAISQVSDILKQQGCDEKLIKRITDLYID